MKHDEQFDRLLDDALKSYAAVEPRSGLEQRVLANLRSAPAPVHHGWLRWAAVTAACLVVASVAVLELRKPEAPVVEVIQPTAEVQKAAAPEASAAAPPRHEPAVRRSPRPAVTARATRPPLAGPPSAQERALVAFVTLDPAGAAALARERQGPPKPISTAELSIPPIAVEPVAVAPVEVAPLEK